MDLTLIILGISTAVLAAWCLHLTRRLAELAELLNAATGLIMKHSQHNLENHNAICAVSRRLDSVQEAATLALNPQKR